MSSWLVSAAYLAFSAPVSSSSPLTESDVNTSLAVGTIAEPVDRTDSGASATGASDRASSTGEPTATSSEPESASLDPNASDIQPLPTTGNTDAPDRRFMLGIEAVGMQVPSLRPSVVGIDPRTVGDTAILGGVGGFFRVRPTDVVGLDLTVRSGSVRYVDTRSDRHNVISQDLITADVGTILYLARGEMGSVGVDAGVGGVFNRIGYALGDDSSSTQLFGSFVTRVGFDVELTTRRIAFVFTLRSFGVITPQGEADNHGPAFDQADDDQRRPASPKFQTYVVGGAGIAYRF